MCIKYFVRTKYFNCVKEEFIRIEIPAKDSSDLGNFIDVRSNVIEYDWSAVNGKYYGNTYSVKKNYCLKKIGTVEYKTGIGTRPSDTKHKLNRETR